MHIFHHYPPEQPSLALDDLVDGGRVMPTLLQSALSFMNIYTYIDIMGSIDDSNHHRHHHHSQHQQQHQRLLSNGTKPE